MRFCCLLKLRRQTATKAHQCHCLQSANDFFLWQKQFWQAKPPIGHYLIISLAFSSTSNTSILNSLLTSTSTMSHLNAGRLNLASLRDVSRYDLFALIDGIEGTKSMIWDSKLVGPFGLISDYGLLKEHKIVQMLELRAGNLPSINAQNLVYFMRPELPFIDIVAGNCTFLMLMPLISFFTLLYYRKHSPRKW